jgi:hypothetical protein
VTDGADGRSPRVLIVVASKLEAKAVAPAQHVLVADVKGPLVEGEEDRARSWGQTLAEVIASRPLPV